jgi:hypothetical protein
MPMQIQACRAVVLPLLEACWTQQGAPLLWTFNARLQAPAMEEYAAV